MNKTKSSLPLFIVGIFIALFVKLSIGKPNTPTPSSQAKPLLIDSTLTYLRYSVELSQILSDKLKNPMLEDFAREIESTNQEQTRKLIRHIINSNWRATYELPQNLNTKLRKAHVLTDQEAADFYFQEMNKQIENWNQLYERELKIDSGQIQDSVLMQDIQLQQTQFGKDIEDILQIKIQASNA